jgi:hypothetical protein
VQAHLAARSNFEHLGKPVLVANDMCNAYQHRTALVIPFFPLRVLPATNHFPQIKDYQMAKKLKRRAWTKADIRTLKGLAKKKTRASSIARVLKRTEGATRQKSFSMGLSLDSRG